MHKKLLDREKHEMSVGGVLSGVKNTKCLFVT